MDSRVHGWLASHCSQDEHSIKAQSVSYEATLKNMAAFFPPASRKFPRKYLLANGHAFLPALMIVLMVIQTPNQTAQS